MRFTDSSVRPYSGNSSLTYLRRIFVKYLTLWICSPDSRLRNSTTELNALIRNSLLRSNFSLLSRSCLVRFSSFASMSLLFWNSSIIFWARRITTLGSNGLYIISETPYSYAFTSLSVVASPVIIITGIELIYPFSDIYSKTSSPDLLGIIKSRKIRDSASPYFSISSIVSTPSAASKISYCSSNIKLSILRFTSTSSAIKMICSSIPIPPAAQSFRHKHKLIILTY